MRCLNLDHIWWIVAPDNPLKKAPSETYERRSLRVAMMLEASSRMHLCALPERERLRYGVELMRFVHARASGARFVWLIGADAFAQTHRWRRWKHFFSQTPLAVFARGGYRSLGALAAPAALWGRRHRQPFARARGLDRKAPPVWVYVPGRTNASASRALRGWASERTSGQRDSGDDDHHHG